MAGLGFTLESGRLRFDEMDWERKKNWGVGIL